MPGSFFALRPAPLGVVQRVARHKAPQTSELTFRLFPHSGWSALRSRPAARAFASSRLHNAARSFKAPRRAAEGDHVAPSILCPLRPKTDCLFATSLALLAARNSNVGEPAPFKKAGAATCAPGCPVNSLAVAPVPGLISQ